MDLELIITSFPKLLSATVVTLKLLSASLFFGLFLGLFFAILRLNKNKLISGFAYGYSYLFRGTPLLVQIFIIYFGLGQIEYLRTTFLWVILKEPYWCAIIAFSLNTGAYTSEILRSAFETIKPGIIEAGRSLGLNKMFIFTDYFKQDPYFPEVFKHLIGSPKVKQIENSIFNNFENIINQDWKEKHHLTTELGAKNVIYFLLDEKNKLIYVGETGQDLKIRLDL